MSQKYTWFVGDTEETGPNTQLHSMHWFGAVKFTNTLNNTFEGKMRPRPETIDLTAKPPRTGYHPDSMKYAGGITFEELLSWPDPSLVMPEYVEWIYDLCEPNTKPFLLTDNTGHDKKWWDMYIDLFVPYTGSETLLGHSSQSIKDRFNGFKQGYEAALGYEVPEEYRSLEAMATTKHDHTPLNDALGRAEAMLKLRDIGFPVVVH
jgi:hypothetical protein